MTNKPKKKKKKSDGPPKSYRGPSKMFGPPKNHLGGYFFEILIYVINGLLAHSVSLPKWYKWYPFGPDIILGSPNNHFLCQLGSYGALGGLVLSQEWLFCLKLGNSDFEIAIQAISDQFRGVGEFFSFKCRQGEKWAKTTPIPAAPHCCGRPLRTIDKSPT